MHGCILFVAVLKILAGGIDGGEVAQDGRLLIERRGDVYHPHAPRLVHLIHKTGEGERGGGGGFSSEDALNLVNPSGAADVGRGGDAAGVGIAEEGEEERPGYNRHFGVVFFCCCWRLLGF